MQGNNRIMGKRPNKKAAITALEHLSQLLHILVL